MDQPTPGALLAAKHLTLAALRAQDPALADQVQALLRQSEQARLVASLEDLPADVVAKVAAVDLVRAIGDVVAHLGAQLVEAGVAAAHVALIVHRARVAKLGTSLGSTQPITAVPVIAKQIAAAHVQEVTTLAALTGTAAAAVAKAAPVTTALDDTAIAKLVTSKAITDAQGKALGLSTALYALTDQSSALAAVIQSASFAQLGGKPAASTADLAKLGPADWTAFLTSSKAPLPAGATPETAGAALARRFAAIEPNVAVFARLPHTTADQLTGSLTSLAALVGRNAGKPVVGADFGQLVTTGLTADQIAAARTTQGQLQQLSNAYPGLGLAALLDDPGTDTATKVGAVDRLVGLVQQVGTQLGSTQVLRLDLSQGSADIATLGLANLRATAGEQTAVLSTLKAYQRVATVTKDIDVMHAVVGAGFTSAHGIAKLPLETFTQVSELDAGSARAIWEASRVTMADVSLATGAILDALSPQHRAFGMSNQPASVVQYLGQLPGYQQLFGSLSFCDCEECQSIIGPAAYFVDLMTYIDTNLRNQFTTPGNPLDLKVRRPDLWTLPLTCANTNTLVPALDIVDQVLENYIAQQVAPGPPALDLSCVTPSAPNVDRSAVQAVVYQQTLFQGEGSFKQPFCLPLARIASYLPALGSSQAAIARAVGAPAVERAQSELGISSPEWTIITTPVSDVTVLSKVYGMTFTQAAPGAPPVWVPPASSPDAAGSPDAAVLGPAMGLSRADLGLVVQTRFVRAGGVSITIVGSIIPGSGAVQNNVEVVNGLTVDALDRMHRFTRMVGKTGWAVSDLDLVLTTLGDTTLGAPGLENVAQLHALQGRFGLAIADLCALVGLIPRDTAGRDEPLPLRSALQRPPVRRVERAAPAAGPAVLPSELLEPGRPAGERGHDAARARDAAADDCPGDRADAAAALDGARGPSRRPRGPPSGALQAARPGVVGRLRPG